MNSTQVTKPTKQEVRTWMVVRQAEKTPLPSQEQIRRELGWGLNAANYKR